MIDRNDIKKLIEAHGTEETLDICFEECGELAQAISKIKRAYRSRERIAESELNLISEMADVLIIMEMLKEIYVISDGVVEAAVRVKMKRNLERIEKGEMND